MLANGTGKALVKSGGDTWFFLTADYAFGHALERDTAAGVTANGGKVLGAGTQPPNNAGFSSSLIHYLKALEAPGGNPHDGRAVVAKMKEMPTSDDLFGPGSIRADGRKIHPAYLFEVKKPAESKYPFDYYKLVATIPADEAFIPLDT